MFYLYIYVNLCDPVLQRLKKISLAPRRGTITKPIGYAFSIIGMKSLLNKQDAITKESPFRGWG